MRHVAITATAVIIGVTALLAGLGTFHRSFIYFPPSLALKDPTAAGVPEMRPIRAADHLVGWYAPARQGHKTLVFFHGNATIIAQYAPRARRLLDAGHGVFLVEYRGYGGNSGYPSEEGLYTDARTALTWLAEQRVPMADVVLWGESLGTGIAVQMASEQSAAALILEAPYTSLPALTPAIIPTATASFLIRDHFDSLAKISRIQEPLLVIHGLADTVIPPAMGQRLLEAAGGEKSGYFPMAGEHADLWRFGAGEAIVDFLNRLN